MEIKVLGTGCASCNTLYNTVVAAVAKMPMASTVTKEQDMEKIIAYNVMRLPALVVDGKVVSTGKKLSEEEVTQLLIQSIN